MVLALRGLVTFVRCVRAVSPGVVVLLQVCRMRGRTIVPVRLRGALHRLLRSRVTVRMQLMQDRANVTLVLHDVVSTPCWVRLLSLPLHVPSRPLRTSVMVLSVTLCARRAASWLTNVLIVRASVLTFARLATGVGRPVARC